MTTSRKAYKIDAENPGSDLAGETAAAMAAASVVFRKSDPHYSHLLLHHAQQVKIISRAFDLTQVSFTLVCILKRFSFVSASCSYLNLATGTGGTTTAAWGQ